MKCISWDGDAKIYITISTMKILNNDGWSDVSVLLVFPPTGTSLPKPKFTSCLNINSILDFNIFT